MRFYTQQHRHYCGIDLHARTMYVCILDQARRDSRSTRIFAARPDPFLEAVAPYRDDLVVAVECIFTWYWLADLCAEEGIPFVLGHALYMKAIHGGKAKNDRIDAHKIAALLRGGMLPQAYVYPRQMRSTRDLLRRRLHLVRNRGQLLAHIQNTNHQYNLPPFARSSPTQATEKASPSSSTTRASRKRRGRPRADRPLRRLIRDLELFIVRMAKEHEPTRFHRLRSIPGVGKILALTILYEVHDIARFPRSSTSPRTPDW